MSLDVQKEIKKIIKNRYFFGVCDWFLKANQKKEKIRLNSVI